MQCIGQNTWSQKNDISGKKTCFGLVLVGVFRMIQLEAMIMGTVATILCVGDDDFDEITCNDFDDCERPATECAE